MPAAFLPNRALVRISGPDAEHFLHNLVTADIEGLPPGEARPSALLTPQGKVLLDFLIWRDGDGFVLDTAAGQSDALIRRLTLYKLRAKVEIAAQEETGVTVSWGEVPEEESLTDMRFAAAGIPVSRRPGQHGQHTIEGYHALRVLAGVAEQPFDFALEDAFPHDVGLDLNQGVSFKKGCYVGQEVVSRMQHRGTARRRVVVVQAEEALPASGTSITAGGKPIGTLGTIAGRRGLAIVRIDRAGEAMAAQQPILAGETPVTLTLPAWTGLSFPATAEEA